MPNTMQTAYNRAANDGFNRPVLTVDLGAHATDVGRYLRALDIPPVTQIIVWKVDGTQVSFIGDPSALSRIKIDRARVVDTTVRNGAIVDTIVSDCWCPGHMLERGHHLPTCGAR